MPRIFAAEFAAIARELAQHRTVEDTLKAIVDKAAATIDGAEDASITVSQAAGRYQTVASTSEFATRVDDLQYKTGEGPCLGSIIDEHIFRSDDVGIDPRWPKFGPLARSQTEVVSMLSHRLFIEDGSTLGALNLYSRKPAAFSTLSIHALDLLATHSAIALARVTAQTENSHLKNALESNRNIGMAMGILMARHNLTSAQAFDLLRLSSQHVHRKLVDIALDVIHTGQLDHTLIDRIERDRQWHPNGSRSVLA